MDDSKIIELYFERDESAIQETKISYGRLLLSVAMAILCDKPESEECENDTYMRAWENIPPTRPSYLSAYLSAITRNLALDRVRKKQSARPLGTALILEELSEVISDNGADPVEEIELRDALNAFLESLSITKRQIFMKRYFFMRSVKEIAKETGMTVGGVKVTLVRVRRELRDFLESRGIVI